MNKRKTDDDLTETVQSWIEPKRTPTETQHNLTETQHKLTRSVYHRLLQIPIVVILVVLEAAKPQRYP